MEAKRFNYWLDEVQPRRNSSPSSDVTDQTDPPPPKRSKRCPSLSSDSSTQVSEQSFSSGSSSLTLGSYYREREEFAQEVSRAVMQLSSRMRIVYRLPLGTKLPEVAITVQTYLNEDFGVGLVPLEFKVCSDSVG